MVTFARMLIDTHTHLYHDHFDSDRDDMMTRAVAAGVELMLLPNIDVASIGPMNELAAKWPDHTRMMMGLHPCHVNADFERELKVIRNELDTGKYIAVGEFGIDLYWDKTYLRQQQEAFRIQVQWAKELGLPIVLHVRDAFEEVFALLDELNDRQLSGVFHCFTGGIAEVERIDGYGGFYFGIGGVLTYKRSGLDGVLSSIPIEKMLLETDSPYLAPVPFRGKRNESGYVMHVAECASAVLGCTTAEVAKQTTENAQRLFRLV
jgi:TatD DNase family protein